MFSDRVYNFLARQLELRDETIPNLRSQQNNVETKPSGFLPGILSLVSFHNCINLVYNYETI